MKRLAFLAVLLTAATAIALPNVTKRKTYTAGQLFTAADYNADRDETVTWVNAMRDLIPTSNSGEDSLAVPYVTGDTLGSRGGVLTLKDEMESKSAADSLDFHVIRSKRVNLDSLYVGGVPVVGFSLASTAGERAFLSYEDTDTLNVDSLTVGGPATFLPGVRVAILGIGDVDTLRADSLTVVGGATVTGAVVMPGTVTMAGIVDVDTLRADSLTVIGGATVTGAVTMPGTVTMSGIVDADTLRADSLTVVGPATITGGARFGADLVPTSADGAALGTTALPFSDIRLASGAILNFGNGDVTLTHQSNTISWSGATSGYNFNGTYAGALLVSGPTYPISSSVTMSSTSNVAFNLSPTFSPSGASNDYILQMLPAVTLDNAGSQSGVYYRLPTVTATKTLAAANGIVIADGVGTGTTTTQIGLKVESLTKGGTNYAIQTGASGLVQIGSLGASSDVQTDGSKNLVTTSDSTMKRLVSRIDPDSALASIRALLPTRYKWKQNAARQPYTEAQIDSMPVLASFFVQEAYEQIPEVSPGGPSLGPDGKDYWPFNSVAILSYSVAAIQAMATRLDSLQAQVDSLKALHP